MAQISIYFAATRYLALLAHIIIYLAATRSLALRPYNYISSSNMCFGLMVHIFIYEAATRYLALWSISLSGSNTLFGTVAHRPPIHPRYKAHLIAGRRITGYLTRQRLLSNGQSTQTLNYYMTACCSHLNRQPVTTAAVNPIDLSSICKSMDNSTPREPVWSSDKALGW